MMVNINLLPWREQLKEQQKKEFFALLGASVLILFLLFLCIHLIIVNQINHQNEDNEYLKNEIKLLDQQIAEIQGLQKQKEELLARMEIIQQLQTDRPKVVRLFDVIAKTVPQGLYLTRLTRQGSNILIDGKAESNTRVSTFMRNIEASSVLRSPLLTLIQADDRKEGEKPSTNFIDRMIGFNLQAVQVGSENVQKSKEATPK